MKLLKTSSYALLLVLVCIVVNSCSTKKNEPTPTQTKSAAKDIVSFSLAGSGFNLTGDVNGTSISALAPAGANITALVPTITVSAKATVSPASGGATDFSKNVTYIVTAEDGSTKTYTVTVSIGKSSTKAITAFAFNGLSPAVAATVDETAKTIVATVPSGTVVTALVPTVAISARAKVSPVSGLAQNFSSPVNYTVTAEDGTTQVYKVTVSINKSSAKAITTFAFNGLSPAVAATVDETAKTIVATVPSGTAVTALVPTVAISARAKVSPVSGLAQNFSSPVNYTVTAEDGSTQAYKVTITVATSIAKVIDCSKVPAVLEDLGDGVDYIVKCNLSLTGSTTLTIKPGVTIQFDGADAGITILNSAALNMVGTAEKPIVLEGKTAVAGSWTGIKMSTQNLLNKWEYVTIQHAGSGVNPAGLLIGDGQFSSGSKISIKNCTFNKNKGYGLWDADNGYSGARNIFTAFENNNFTNNETCGLNVTIDQIGKLDTKSHYGNNGGKYIEVHGVNGLFNNTTVQKLDVPYLIADKIPLRQKMTVMPGVNFQFYIDAGFFLSTGTLIAKGTAANPIKFTGFEAGVGYWIGLSLGNDDPQIALDYCIIDGAGSNKPNSSTACVSDTKGAVNFFPSCNNWSTKSSITNCTVSNSGGYGIIYKKGTAIVITNNTYSGNTLDNVKTF